MENNLMVYQSVITDIKNIINAGQQEAYGAASKAMVLTYWNVGKRIVEQEQAGKEHAEYGKKLLENSTNIFQTRRFGTHAFRI